MRYEESLAATIEAVKRHAQVNRPIKPSDQIMTDLGVDSIGVMELVSDLELAFDVSIPKELYESLSTVDDVAKALVTLKAERKAG
jgi:acyl carrier protein